MSRIVLYMPEEVVEYPNATAVKIENALLKFESDGKRFATTVPFLVEERPASH